MEFTKYHKIKILGNLDNKGIFDDPEDEIICQEKMDGANFRFMIIDGKIIFGSRTQQLTSDTGEDTNMQKNFLRCTNFVRDTLNGADLTGMQNIVFFGECMTKHTMNYDWEKVPPFLGFDAYNLEMDEWIGFSILEELFDIVKLPMVPLIDKLKAGAIKELTDKDVPISAYGLDQAEGIVLKNYSKGLFAKYVRDKFKEDNRKAFGMIKKYTANDDEFLTAAYCTNARIDKMIFKLVDEGNEIDMPLMKLLPTRVYKDIWEENWEEIMNMRNKSCHFHHFKKLVTGRCLSVLKQVIINNGINEGLNDKQNT